MAEPHGYFPPFLEQGVSVGALLPGDTLRPPGGGNSFPLKISHLPSSLKSSGWLQHRSKKRERGFQCDGVSGVEQEFRDEEEQATCDSRSSLAAELAAAFASLFSPITFKQLLSSPPLIRFNTLKVFEASFPRKK